MKIEIVWTEQNMSTGKTYDTMKVGDIGKVVGYTSVIEEDMGFGPQSRVHAIVVDDGGKFHSVDIRKIKCVDPLQGVDSSL